jgi:hypothetical protein
MHFRQQVEEAFRTKKEWGMSGARASASTIAMVALLLGSGCASTQLNYNAVEISGTIDSVYTREALNNLSKFIDDPKAIPSQVTMIGGTIQTANTVNPSVTFPLSPQFARTAGPTGLTVTTASTFAGAGAGVNGTNTATQNYTISPLSDANTLRNQQALYRHAVFGTRLIGNYDVPQIFFQDKFYDDPYHLQEPHCVLCALKQGVFSGEQHPAVHVNAALRPKWLYWDNDPRLSELSEPVDLGHYGNHELFMSRTDFNNGVLTNFVLFTLPNTEPAETFTPVVHLTPGTPGAASVTLAPSGSNIRMQPASRQAPALVIPQSIVPAQ